jgi:hypothetical protein
MAPISGFNAFCDHLAEERNAFRLGISSTASGDVVDELLGERKDVRGVDGGGIGVGEEVWIVDDGKDLAVEGHWFLAENLWVACVVSMMIEEECVSEESRDIFGRRVG